MRSNVGWLSAKSFLVMAVAGAIATAAVIAVPAWAQFGQGRPQDDELFRPQVTRRDVTAMVDLLKLDEMQRDLVTSLLEDYQIAFRADAEKIQAQMDDIRREMEATGDRRDWRTMMRPLREKRAEMTRISDRLKESFVTDVQAVLSAEQVELWPAYERRVRRLTLLPRGRIAGEGVNLFDVVEVVQLDAAARLAIEPLLDEYDLRLDSALVRRESEREKIADEFREMMRDGNIVRALDLAGRERKMRTAIRDLNEKYARLIEFELADPQPFHEEFRLRAYPRVWHSTYVQRLFEAALALEEVEPNTLQAIEAMNERFQVRLRTINEGLQRITREHDATSIERRIGMIEATLQRRVVDRNDDPIRQGFNERSEYENRTRKQLESLLTEEQVALLPQQAERPEAQGRRGPRGGAGGDRGGFRGFIREGNDRGGRRGRGG